jgi:spore germination protein GerM
VTLRQLIVALVVLITLSAAMFVYVWQLRRQTIPVTTTDNLPPVTPPKAGPAENVTLWVAENDPGVLRARSVSVPLASGRQQQAEELLRSLLGIYSQEHSAPPLRAGSEIHAVYLVEPGLAVVDINTAMADSQTSGILAEELTIASLVQSLSTNIQGISQVKILVDGKERETLAGHADISGTYEVSQISELAKQLAQ